MLGAGKVENTKKKRFLANWLKEKSAVVPRKISSDGLFNPNYNECSYSQQIEVNAMVT